MNSFVLSAQSAESTSEYFIFAEFSKEEDMLEVFALLEAAGKTNIERDGVLYVINPMRIYENNITLSMSQGDYWALLGSLKELKMSIRGLQKNEDGSLEVLVSYRNEQDLFKLGIILGRHSARTNEIIVEKEDLPSLEKKASSFGCTIIATEDLDKNDESLKDRVLLKIACENPYDLFYLGHATGVDFGVHVVGRRSLYLQDLPETTNIGDGGAKQYE